MNFIDIRKALTSLISTKFNGVEVRYDEINNINRPCFFINLVDYKKTMDKGFRDFKELSLDIMYFPTIQKAGVTEIYEALETLDLSFEQNGYRALKVNDRVLKLKNVALNETDKIGHYLADIELYDVYGDIEAETNYPNMENLKYRGGKN